jgi:nucleolar protein 12
VSAWREQEQQGLNDGIAGEDDLKSDAKKFLSSKEKKKIAFINHEFHDSADTVNAYVVFAHRASTENRSANVPPPPVTMDPYEAASMAASACERTIFMERMLRVDVVGAKRNTVDRSATSSNQDMRLSIFVGNLDFTCKEEDLRAFF